MKNDYLDYLEHSAKGSSWKEHKYIAIKNGKYIYETAKNKVKSTAENVKNAVTKKIEDQKNVNEILNEQKNNSVKVSKDTQVSNEATIEQPKNILDYRKSSPEWREMISLYQEYRTLKDEALDYERIASKDGKTAIADLEKYKKVYNDYVKAYNAWETKELNWVKENLPDQYDDFKEDSTTYSQEEINKTNAKIDDTIGLIKKGKI